MRWSGVRGAVLCQVVPVPGDAGMPLAAAFVLSAVAVGHAHAGVPLVRDVVLRADGVGDMPLSCQGVLLAAGGEQGLRAGREPLVMCVVPAVRAGGE